ncbi:MAG TPA: VOC family protein [Trebonia sp.]|jgi:hypothetical protein|nr:VOC family protein [Trebonia sp.]
MSTDWTVTIDCVDPARLAAFWCQALGYIEDPPPEGFASWEAWLAAAGVPPEEWADGAFIADPEGVLPAISFLKVPQPKTAKNRVHVDVQAGGGRGGPWEARWPLVTEAVGRLGRRDRHPGGCASRHPGPHGAGRSGGQRVLRAVIPPRPAARSPR